MLVGLHIENVAVIECLDLTLGQGFHVFTGETGAGKSIIIDSIAMVLGGRGTRELVRQGADKALVQALFSVSDPELCRELELSEPEVLLSRELYADGRSLCRLNGAMVTAGTIRELAPRLLCIHGQHDNQALLQGSKHLSFLDRFAKNEELLASYQEAFRQMRETERQLEELEQQLSERQRRQEALQQQIEEIDEAALRAGEEEELETQYRVLEHAHTIARNTQAAYEGLYGNGGVHDALYRAMAQVEEIASFDPVLESFLQRLRTATTELDDIAGELRSYGNALEQDPYALQQAEQRLDTIRRICKKYGPTEEAVLQYRSELGEEWESLERAESRLEELRGQRQQARARAEELARVLSQSRRQAAKVLEQALEEPFASLDMPHMKFSVSQEEAELGSNGADRIEFLISPNPGEPLKPLAKIASGGELSRLMLALQTVLSGGEETLIFDEIDTGVSGRAAQRIAEKLHQVAKTKQVLCITHLAQLAAMGDHHYGISKTVVEGHAKTSVTCLTGRARLEELARISGGAEITELTLQNAEQMLCLAQKQKGIDRLDK